MKKLHWFSNIKWGETYLSLILGCPWNILFSCALDIWLRVRIAHYSKSPIFVQKFNFDKIFEFLRQNWKNIHEYFILKSVKWLSFRGISFDFDPKLNLQNNGKKFFDQFLDYSILNSKPCIKIWKKRKNTVTLTTANHTQNNGELGCNVGREDYSVEP